MAVFNIKFNSGTLRRNVNLVACIPVDSPENFDGSKGYKTLYLLHGMHGNETDWLQKTTVSELSEKHNIAIIMPSGENSFYLNHPNRMENYSDFIGEELVEFTRRTFPLSDKREDTFIGGLSMGGYGATLNGLKYSDTFGGIIALSSAFLLSDVQNVKPGKEGGIPYEYWVDTFGEPDKVAGSEADYEHYALQLIKSKVNLPKLYIACGTEDFLIEQNREFHTYLTKIGYTHSYTESPGEHNWDFWREYIITALSVMI